MEGAAIPDIRPFIANDQRAVRFYLCVVVIVIVLGFLLGISVLAIFKSVGDYRDLEKIAGGAAGGIASFLTGFVPVKEVLARLDRLRILRAVEARLAVPTEAPEEYVKLVWKMYEKAAAG